MTDVDEAAAVDWLRRAVQTPSVTGDEMTFAALVASELEACGASEVHLEEVLPDRPIVWSVTRGTGGGPSVLLAGHLDTVRVDGWRERWKGTEREHPFGAALVDGAVWGRGSGDLKAGIATAMGALRTLHASGTALRGDVVTVWVCDEESGEPGLGRSLGMHAASERLAAGAIPRADFAIYLEPTSLAVLSAQIGFLIADISLQGRSAYFGRPDQGIDALRAGHVVLGELWRLDDELRASGEHPLLGTLAGPAARVLETTFRESVQDVFGPQPRAAMLFAADYAYSFLPPPLRTDGAAFFPFPAIAPGSRDDVVVGGDVAVMFTRTAAAQRLIRFLATPAGAEPWVAAGGFVSPNRGVDRAVYPDALTRRAAAMVTTADTVRFDLSDAQPPAFGVQPDEGMQAILQDLVRRPGDVEEMARRLERAAP